MRPAHRDKVSVRPDQCTGQDRQGGREIKKGRAGRVYTRPDRAGPLCIMRRCPAVCLFLAGMGAAPIILVIIIIIISNNRYVAWAVCMIRARRLWGAWRPLHHTPTEKSPFSNRFQFVLFPASLSLVVPDKPNVPHMTFVTMYICQKSVELTHSWPAGLSPGVQHSPVGSAKPVDGNSNSDHAHYDMGTHGWARKFVSNRLGHA